MGWQGMFLFKNFLFLNVEFGIVYLEFVHNLFFFLVKVVCIK